MKHETIPVVVQNLLDARARIANGWCKGVFLTRFSGGVHVSYCALGAIGYTSGCSRNTKEEAWLTTALPVGASSVPDYNDSLKTTHADILALFDRAIELAAAAS
jgi:hypothetical protein